MGHLKNTFYGKELDMWIDTKHGASGLTFQVKRHIHQEQTEFQKIDVIETVDFGNMLLIDGRIMATDRDEFVYHEMITHVPINCHPSPKQTLVIGGGDGGTLREICRHGMIEEALLVEIDARIIDISREYFPCLASAFDHPKSRIVIQEGISFMDSSKNRFDLIITDSTDPYGPGQGLFQKGYYKTVFNALRDDGMLVAQTESVFYDLAAVREIYENLSQVFPFVTMYWAPVPTYPGGGWTFCLCSKVPVNPMKIRTPEDEIERMGLKYYNTTIHQGSFYLPKFITDSVGRHLTWTAGKPLQK